MTMGYVTTISQTREKVKDILLSVVQPNLNEKYYLPK